MEFCARYIRQDGNASYLRCAHVAMPGRVLSFTATAPIARADACEALMDGVLESLQLRDGD